jgi:hypothetical protein
MFGAKDDVDNVGAGRAAKGENLSIRAKKHDYHFLVIVLFCL